MHYYFTFVPLCITSFWFNFSLANLQNVQISSSGDVAKHKTLLISYLPSGTFSKTKILLDHFLESINGHEIEKVDLLTQSPPIFTEESLAAYFKRNYAGQTLTEAESSALAENDRLIAQFQSADVIVIAAPFHNFGLPGIVKSYLDAVMFNGKTFEFGKKAMAGKKSLTIFTSGGQYSPDSVDFSAGFFHWDTLTQSIKIMFNFMGFDEVQIVGASLRDETTRAERVAEARSKIRAIVSRWYE